VLIRVTTQHNERTALALPTFLRSCRVWNWNGNGSEYRTGGRKVEGGRRLI